MGRLANGACVSSRPEPTGHPVWVARQDAQHPIHLNSREMTFSSTSPISHKTYAKKKCTLSSVFWNSNLLASCIFICGVWRHCSPSMAVTGQLRAGSTPLGPVRHTVSPQQRLLAQITSLKLLRILCFQAPSARPPRVQPSGFCHMPDSVPGAGNQQGVNQTRDTALRGADDQRSPLPTARNTAPSSQSTSPLADSCPVGLQILSAMSLPGGDLGSTARSRTF